MTITVSQALKLLNRMQEAAPPPTAEKLAEIGDLLQTLSSDGSTPASGEAESILGEEEILILQIETALRPALETIRSAAPTASPGMTGLLKNSPQQVAGARILDAATGALSLLDSVRQLIAIRSGLIEITPLIFSPVQVLREAERLVHDRAEARNHQISIQSPNTMAQARGDYQRILVIVTDLLDNAIRYTPPGGVIRASVENLGTHVLFTVEDSGIGLRPEDLEHIGEAFWRATDQPLVAEHYGSGLRLHIHRQVLAMQNGELFFSGDPAMGSTFSFTLPAAG